MRSILAYICIVKLIVLSAKVTKIDINDLEDGDLLIKQPKTASCSGYELYTQKHSTVIYSVYDEDTKIWGAHSSGERLHNCTITKFNGNGKLLSISFKYFNDFMAIRRYRKFLGVWIPISKKIYKDFLKEYTKASSEIHITFDIASGTDKKYVATYSIWIGNYIKNSLFPRQGYKITKVVFGGELLWEKNDYQEEVIEIASIYKNLNLTLFSVTYETYYNTADTLYFKFVGIVLKISREEFNQSKDSAETLIPYNFDQIGTSTTAPPPNLPREIQQGQQEQVDQGTTLQQDQNVSTETGSAQEEMGTENTNIGNKQIIKSSKFKYVSDAPRPPSGQFATPLTITKLSQKAPKTKGSEPSNVPGGDNSQDRKSKKATKRRLEKTEQSTERVKERENKGRPRGRKRSIDKVEDGSKKSTSTLDPDYKPRRALVTKETGVQTRMKTRSMSSDSETITSEPENPKSGRKRYVDESDSDDAFEVTEIVDPVDEILPIQQLVKEGKRDWETELQDIQEVLDKILGKDSDGNKSDETSSSRKKGDRQGSKKADGINKGGGEHPGEPYKTPETTGIELGGSKLFTLDLLELETSHGSYALEVYQEFGITILRLLIEESYILDELVLGDLEIWIKGDYECSMIKAYVIESTFGMVEIFVIKNGHLKSIYMMFKEGYYERVTRLEFNTALFEVSRNLSEVNGRKNKGLKLMDEAEREYKDLLSKGSSSKSKGASESKKEAGEKPTDEKKDDERSSDKKKDESDEHDRKVWDTGSVMVMEFGVISNITGTPRLL